MPRPLPQQLAIGIDCGGTKMLGVAVDPKGAVVAEHRLPTPYDPDEFINSLIEIVEHLEQRLGVTDLGIGVGMPGLVDRSGTLHFGPNIGRITGFEVHKLLARHFDERTICIENDNTCAAWAEHCLGAGRGFVEMTYVGLGTGIGGGIITGGKLLHGRQGFSAEMGHMTIVVDGVLCACGRLGCWEAYASGNALGRLGREAAIKGKNHRVLQLAGAIEDIRGEHVVAAAREGDASARGVLDEFAFWLAAGIANLVALLDPEVVVIGGGLSEEADLFLGEAKRQLTERVMGSSNRPTVSLAPAALRRHAGGVGAAMLIHTRSS